MQQHSQIVSGLVLKILWWYTEYMNQQRSCFILFSAMSFTMPLHILIITFHRSFFLYNCVQYLIILPSYKTILIIATSLLNTCRPAFFLFPSCVCVRRRGRETCVRLLILFLRGRVCALCENTAHWSRCVGVRRHNVLVLYLVVRCTLRRHWDPFMFTCSTRSWYRHGMRCVDIS